MALSRPSPAALALAILATLLLQSPQVLAGEPPRSEAARPEIQLERSLAEAEYHLATGEPQLAESTYRGVLLEAWHLRGLLAVAGGDLVAARGALERSTASAAVGVLAPQIDLALVLHRLGETDDALQRLRALSRQFRSEPEAWRALVGTLVADGRLAEVAEQLEDLRLVLPEAAAELEASLTGIEDSIEARAARRPRIDLGRLGSERERLAAAVDEAIARADRALAVLVDARARATSVEDLEALLDAAPETLTPAVEAIRRGRPREAEGLLRRAQKQGYDSPDVERLLAFARDATGDGVQARLELARIAGEGAPKAALELLAEARRRAPSSEEVLAAHARIATSVGLTATALEALEPLVGVFPHVAEYSYLLGTARVRLGLMTEAVEALQAAVQLAPGEAPYRLALAEALNHEKRFDEAESHLLAVLETSPEDLAAMAALAQAEEGLDKLESAEQRAAGVLARSPHHAGAHLVIGMVRMKQERYAEARAALERAVDAEPGGAKAHYQLSLACMRLGDREAARRHRDLYRAALDGAEGATGELKLESGASPAGKENPR